MDILNDGNAKPLSPEQLDELTTFPAVYGIRKFVTYLTTAGH
jgi:hypothetical protein